MNKKKVASSPEKLTFQRDSYIRRQKEEGRNEDDENVAAMIDYYDNWLREAQSQVEDPAWQENNLEYDLRSTDWICDKAKLSTVYAQNLYAALCNNEFVNSDTFNILKEDYWSASWRRSGGIVADMREEGDYIDWYCSGIRNDGYQDDLDVKYPNGYVPEGTVTNEVRDDLKTLGWFVIIDKEI